MNNILKQFITYFTLFLIASIIFFNFSYDSKATDYSAAPNPILDTITLTANPGPANNGGSAGWAMFFDLIAGSQNIIVTQMSTASNSAASGSFTVEIFTRSGTGLGTPGTSSTGWTSIGTVPVTQGPTSNGISLVFSVPPISVLAGDTVGVALQFAIAGPRYYGTGTPPYEVYTDANLTLITGDARSAPFTSGGSYFHSRALCGVIRYVVGGSSGVFCEDFDGFTVGGRLACQDSINWTTWSLDPCNTTEDPLISSAQSVSPSNSVVIVYNNDLVKPLGNDTTGIHKVTFQFYVPTGKAGYWNTLATFAAPTYQWGMECYFDVAATGNNGRLFGGSSTAVPFAYTHGAWHTTTLIVNLDIDSAKFIMNGTVIHTWRWTAGASGTAVPKRLAANDFFGATSVDEMYMDNFCYYPDANWLITGVTQNGNTLPTDYVLSQNYPNPFNPTTTINFTIPTTGLVVLKVYNVLGKEVATLVNETKNAGSYNVNFNGTNLTSGVYFYKIEVRGFATVKKMLLMK
ncbi:T9SS type A sorting domain-containing protein [Bacteroidota bacterium]